MSRISFVDSIISDMLEEWKVHSSGGGVTSYVLL